MSDGFGKYLKDLRVKAGIAQADVSKAFGYGTPQFISNWERDVAMPPVETIKKLGGLYNTDPQEIFNRYEEVVLDKIHKSLARKFKVSSKRA